MVSSSMKWAGTSSPSGFLRRPVSIGWLTSRRTSTTSPSNFARTLIAFAMSFPPSAAAAAERHLDFLCRVEVLAARAGERVHVAGLVHLHARLNLRQGAGR